MTLCTWSAPPEAVGLRQVDLQPGEVHIWKASLDVPAERIQSLAALLTQDETERADRFHFARDRRRFIVARGILRSILARYTGLAPEDLSLCYGAFGKPALAPECGGAWLQFNVAHASELVLYGVTCDSEIGVDLEHLCAGLADRQIAEHFFAPAEVAQLRSVTGEAQVAAFFNCWTRKEAYIKARGMGVSLPLDQFEVSLLPGAPATLLKAEAHQNPAQWSMRSLDPEPGYVAALAMRGVLKTLCCWNWAGPYRSDGHATL